MRNCSSWLRFDQKLSYILNNHKEVIKKSKIQVKRKYIKETKKIPAADRYQS